VQLFACKNFPHVAYEMGVGLTRCWRDRIKTALQLPEAAIAPALARADELRDRLGMPGSAAGVDVVRG
jgi:hypothetical protein